MGTYKLDISIGMPVYNVEKYIKRSILSVLNQSIECNLEILVIDDCGTDHSIDIVRDLQQNHPRGKDIRIVRQPHNMGCWAARNRVLDEAQGKYIFLIDSDDYLFEKKIKLLVCYPPVLMSFDNKTVPCINAVNDLCVRYNIPCFICHNHFNKNISRK